MNGREEGSVELDGLDGARSWVFNLPANWHGMSDDEQNGFVHAILTQLMNDSVSWSVDAPIIDGCECHNCGYNS